MYFPSNWSTYCEVIEAWVCPGFPNSIPWEWVGLSNRGLWEQDEDPDEVLPKDLPEEQSQGQHGQMDEAFGHQVTLNQGSEFI